MTLLLDTHTVLWLTEDIPRLGRAAKRRCDAALAANDLAVPTVVFYEVARAVIRGRVEGSSSVLDWRSRILASGVREIPLSADIAMRAADIENLRDPFDRIIVATALAEDAVLLTADRPILGWAGNLRRHDARR